MIAMAGRLQAKVQGDDGEWYDESYFNPPASKNVKETKKQPDSKPWWKFW